MTQHNFTTIALTLTINRNGHSTTWPLTPLLLLLWLMAAVPPVADCFETASRLTQTALTLMSATLITIIFAQIFIKSLAWGVRL